LLEKPPIKETTLAMIRGAAYGASIFVFCYKLGVLGIDLALIGLILRFRFTPLLWFWNALEPKTRT